MRRECHVTRQSIYEVLMDNRNWQHKRELVISLDNYKIPSMVFNRSKMLTLKFTVFVIVCIVQARALPGSNKNCVFVQEQCPNDDVNFYLYTKERQTDPIHLDMRSTDSVINAPFVKSRPLVVLIHGYTGHKDFAPNTQIRPAYFAKDEYNIISIDYKNLALQGCYINAVANIATVANCTAQLLDFLIDKNIFTLDSIHVIGFSLGSQTAGMVANYLKDGRQLKRITGLDPAKPMFTVVGKEDKLDKSDAEFVEWVWTLKWFRVKLSKKK